MVIQMKKWRKLIFISLPLLFIAANLFLIVKKESNIARMENIDFWRNVQVGHLQDTLLTKGVVIPEEDYHIYFDRRNGLFNQFYVNEGEAVSNGSKLFEYTPYNNEKEIEMLEREITELENKTNSVESVIDQLENLLDQATSEQEETDERNSIYSIQANIYEKELERDKYTHEANTLQEQIQALKAGSAPLTLESEFDGYVKKINYDLSDPIITISSRLPSVQGVLDEFEVRKVETGMNASILGLSPKKSVEGIVTEVEALPNHDPHLSKKSQYTFYIQPADESEELFLGNHVQVEILLREAEAALIVPEKSIKRVKDNSYVYILTPAGTIEERLVDSGINKNNKVEIVSGMNKENVIVSNAKEIKFGAESPFTTPLKWNEIEKKDLRQNLKSNWKKIIHGFFVRY